MKIERILERFRDGANLGTMEIGVLHDHILRQQNEITHLRIHAICTRVHEPLTVSHYADVCDLTRRERDAATIPKRAAPTFNHSREDSPLAPCIDCAAAMSAPALRLAIKDMRSVIDDERRRANEAEGEIKDNPDQRATRAEKNALRLCTHGWGGEGEMIGCSICWPSRAQFQAVIQNIEKENERLVSKIDRITKERDRLFERPTRFAFEAVWKRAENSERLATEIERLKGLLQAARLDATNAQERSRAETSAPIPLVLYCPGCHTLHVDEGDFAPGPNGEPAKKPHHTHACQNCPLVWRPAIVNTVGVRFLPGFKNEKKTCGAFPDSDPTGLYWEPCTLPGNHIQALCNNRHKGETSTKVVTKAPTCNQSARLPEYAPCSRPPHTHGSCSHHLRVCPFILGTGACGCNPRGFIVWV